ncbi:TonB-dependent receptor [Sphingobium sp.]|uniref:TonB-dependent receptor n=1 Tax=Sphingobium sp. TaxID=1912891 RepID=UPI0028BE6A9A|nr:TonB-dependent receptor [Sphingobium sp.]
MKAKARIVLTLGASCWALAAASGAAAQAEGSETPQADTAAVGEIIVTAQRRSESINRVGMSISALTGNALLEKQISSPSDLARIVPGFTAQPTPYNTPVYTLRGVGFYDSSLAASPSVSVYVDEVPLPYSAMTKGASFDLERVEVLKGPQGTLYGQNATGGAINYIAAKPTSTPTAGFDVSFGRFATLETGGFVSGPISSTLNARVAVRTVQAGDWQKSYTRDAELGDKDQLQGRLLLDWKPAERFSLLLNLNGWRDRGDTQAAQLAYIDLQAPAGPPLSNYPLAPNNARAADWNPTSLRRHEDFWQVSAHAQYELSSDLVLHSLTSYAKLDTRAQQDTDGLAVSNFDASILPSYIKSLSQELRLSFQGQSVNGTIGANYGHDNALDVQGVTFPVASNNRPIPGVVEYNYASNFGRQKVDTYAVFASGEVEIASGLKLLGGMRYTRVKRHFEGCQTNGGNAQTAQSLTNLANIFRGAVGLPAIPLEGLNDCSTLNDATLVPELIRDTLDEDNLSWRAGVNWEVAPGKLVYANVSRGFKGGGYPTVGSTLSTQYQPVVQEELIAYEAGFKLSLLDRRMQLNGAAFYYDYRDKQIRAKIQVPIFNLVEGIVNVPKSRIYGFEGQVVLAPVRGLNLSGAVSYLNTKIERFTGFDLSGENRDFAGSRLPFTPKWSANADAEYQWGVNAGLNAFVGGTLAYSSSTNASIGYPDRYHLPSYTTVDLRAGVKAADDAWRFTVWGRNITNEYYWTNVAKLNDTIVKYAAMPVTYGASFTHRF